MKTLFTALLILMSSTCLAEELIEANRIDLRKDDLWISGVIEKENGKIHILTIVYKEQIVCQFSAQGEEKNTTLYPVDGIQIAMSEKGNRLYRIQLSQKGNSEFYYDIQRKGNEFYFEEGELHEFMKKAKGYNRREMTTPSSAAALLSAHPLHVRRQK